MRIARRVQFALSSVRNAAIAVSSSEYHGASVTSSLVKGKKRVHTSLQLYPGRRGVLRFEDPVHQELGPAILDGSAAGEN